MYQPRIITIKELRTKGQSYAKIGKVFDISGGRVGQLLKREELKAKNNK